MNLLERLEGVEMRQEFFSMENDGILTHSRIVFTLGDEEVATLSRPLTSAMKPVDADVKEEDAKQ